MVDRDKYESKYGVFHPCDEKARKDGSQRHS